MGEVQIYKKPISAKKILSMSKTRIGDKLLFVDKTIGIVIEGGYILEKCVVNGKALLLTKYPSGPAKGRFWGSLALGWLDYKVKRIDRI